MGGRKKAIKMGNKIKLLIPHLAAIPMFLGYYLV
jgi:hypothetical protein